MAFNDSNPKQAVARHNDGLDVLKGIIEMANDPKKFKAMHEAARAENVLTEEQEAKYKDALEFMAHYEQMNTEINNRRDMLEDDEKAHHGEKERFDKFRTDEEARLKKKDDDLKEFETGLNGIKKQMKDEWDEKMRDYSAKVTPLDNQSEQNKKDKAANDKERERLKQWAARLDKRDKRVKDAVSEEEEAA